MAHDKLIVDQANLESSTYEHMKMSLDYDCQQWRVYAGKIHNHSKTVYSQKLQWDSQQHVNALKIADKFLQDSTRLIHIKDSALAQTAYLDYSQVVKDIAQSLQLDPQFVVTTSR